jgi:hypothetical protein
VLARVLQTLSGALEARGLEVKLRSSDAVFLPASGFELYRRLRALLGDVTAQAARGRIKLAVHDFPGKSYVEVTATFACGRGARVLSAAFRRYDPAVLPHGFAEQAEPEGAVVPSTGAA